MKVSISRPRVYLIDFETAVKFPAECPSNERVLVGFPVAVAESYARAHAPEFTSRRAYCPFKLDVWQLGSSFSGFKVWQYIFIHLFFLFAYSFLFFRAPFPQLIISKKDGNRHSNVFKKYVDILMYCKNRKLFGIHMTAILVL